MATGTGRKPSAALPAFITPMLAKPGAPFDADDYLFEIKWDGTRTLAFVDQSGYRLVNRRRLEMTDRYPEFAFLTQLPPGTVLDGEMVVLRDGKPDFALLQSREHSRSPFKVGMLGRCTPATYVVFDLLYESFKSLMAQPLKTRRQRLARLVKRCDSPRLVLSEGMVKRGKAFFEAAVRQNLEGAVAKRLTSPYLPGKRTDAWIKIKRGATIHCAIIGFIPTGSDDFRSLILANEVDGELRCVGKVGSGIGIAERAALNKLLWSRLQPRPLVPCKIRGKWVAPGLYCKISYLERTPSGDFRAPVFLELCEE
jgi:bifunctional non-homologous end joining protein LigD